MIILNLKCQSLSLSHGNLLVTYKGQGKKHKDADSIRTDYFYNLVSGFNSNYVSNENYFKISYEELYYGKGLQEIINYLNLDCVKNESFPYGKKYRIDLVRNKLIWRTKISNVWK